MEGYSLKILGVADLKELNELYKTAFLREKKEGFFRWKYFENPVKDAIVAGAFINDKLVGSGAMVPEKMNVLGKVETVYKCTDLMTHPEHQRKGLSKKVNELLTKKIVEANVPFLYTMCSKVSTKSFVKNNWMFMEEVSNYFKPYQLLKLLHPFKKSKHLNCTSYNEVGNYLDDYEFKILPKKISIAKSPAFLQWRTSNPNFIYKIICHYDSNRKIDGYLIYSVSKNNMLNVIDIDCYGNDKKISNQLLRCAEYTVVKENYAGIVIMAIKKSLFQQFLKNQHYLSNPYQKGPLTNKIDFDIYVYNKNLANINNLTTWNVYGLNYDDV